MIRSKVASNSQVRCFQKLLQRWVRWTSVYITVLELKNSSGHCLMHSFCYRGAQYATKAEEYNLIAQEQGLSRIEG